MYATRRIDALNACGISGSLIIMTAYREVKTIVSSRRKSQCNSLWGSHGCNKRYPHRNHRCNCGMVVARDGAIVKPYALKKHDHFFSGIEFFTL